MTYHPHGTSAGQIGHNSNIDTGLTPGSDGGKFIGFGEPGSSAIGNRAHWALSENIDHVYQEVHREIAVPKGYDRTSPGGGESSFQFPSGEEVWVGDDTYPGSAGSSDAEGMHMLFDVLDSNYNELTDGSGNEIRVSLVRESTNTTDVYQGGNPFLDSFQDQPIIHFVAVDPESGVVVTDPYTIPAATNYKVQCGVKSTIAELPADALVRYKVQGASEVEAGVFLQDGSRPLLGDLDVGGNDIVGFTGLLSLVTASLQDTLNAGVEAQEALVGNRAMDKTGSISTSNEDVTYPALKVVLQGQVVDIASDTISAPLVADTYYLYVTPAGVVTLSNDATWGDSVATPTAGSVLIWKGDFDGATVWTNPVDLRWPNSRRGYNASIYVGSGIGADFTSLNDAVTWGAQAFLGVNKTNISYEIVIVGEATVTSTVTLPAGWTLRGLAKHGQSAVTSSVIKTSTGFTTTTNVIVTGANCTVKNLEINWNHSTTDQDSSNFGLYIVSNCLVEGVKFSGTRQFGNNLKVEGAVDNSGPIVRDCYFDDFGVTGGVGLTARGQGRIHVENCTFITDVLATCSINFEPSGAAVDARGPSHTVQGCYFKGTAAYANILVAGPNVLIDSCQAELTSTNDLPFISIEPAASQSSAGVTVRNCLAENGYQFVSCAVSDSAVRLSVVIDGCTLTGFEDRVFNFNCTAVAPGSSVDIKDCVITGHTAGYVGYFKAIASNFISNQVIDSAGTGLYVLSTKANIEGNYIRTWGSGVGITFDTSSSGSIRNNTLQYSGSTADTVGVLVEYDSEGIVIDGNYVLGDNDDASVAVRLRGAGNCVTNNHFKNWSQYYIHIDTDNAGAGNQQIKNNFFDGGCGKQITEGSVTDVAASAILIDGTLAANNILVSGNLFKSQSGSALRGDDATVANDLMISDNVFYQVGGRYLIAGPSRQKHAVLYVGNGTCSISNNRFTSCGHAYTAIQAGAIYSSIVHLFTSDTVHVVGNSFRDSKASARTDVNEVLMEINIWYADVICTNNNFYKDLSDAQSTAFGGYYQISGGTGGDLFLSGCLFQLVGTVTIQPSSGCSCVRAQNGGVYASGCFSLGTWSQSASARIWDLEGSGYGSVMGCVFTGNRDVWIRQTGGFCVGNMHRRNASGPSGTMTVGSYPVADTYTALSGSGPRAEFNKTLDTLS